MEIPTKLWALMSKNATKREKNEEINLLHTTLKGYKAKRLHD
jgi:hypothetical protein